MEGYMQVPIKTVYIGKVSETVEKKSKFITTIKPVNTEEEALRFIDEIKKRYRDASHNCYAYVLGIGDNLQRCTDDGEPGGTAGKPILDVLLGEGLHNTLAVVTRYFGGTLLGTGGLVKAYTNAVKEGLKGCKIIEKQMGETMEINVDYTDLGKLQYTLAEKKISVLDTVYTDKVTLQIIAPIDKSDEYREAVIQATNGKVRFKITGKQCFGQTDGDVIIFP